jgi:hypothetical protein
MNLFFPKQQIPQNTLIFVGHILPLISVFRGELNYAQLIALFYFDFLFLIITGRIKLFGAPFSYNVSNARINAFNENWKASYRKDLTSGYLFSHFFMLVFYSLVISLPIGMYMQLGKDIDANFFNQLPVLLNQHHFWWLFGVLAAAHVLELITFFIIPLESRPFAEKIVYLDVKLYLITYVVAIVGAILISTTSKGYYSNELTQGMVFGTGFTFIKLYMEFRRLR